MLHRIAVACCLLLSLRADAQILIDHTNTDLGALSDSAIASAAATTLHFRHASIGVNISDGLDDLDASNSKYDRSNWLFFDRGNPGWPGKIDDFESFVADHAAEYDVLTMKFCSIDNGADWPTHRDSMEVLETAYPGNVFVWWTMPFERYTVPSSGHRRRHEFNVNVRAYCVAQGKILFDIADIESHDPAGNRVVAPDGYDVMHPGYTDDVNHLNKVGRVRVASAFWHLMASVSGGASPGSTVWVDFSYGPGTELGTESQPFNTLGEGISLVTASGTIKAKAGQSAETPRITKAMRIEALNGTVRIGASGGGKTVSKQSEAIGVTSGIDEQEDSSTSDLLKSLLTRLDRLGDQAVGEKDEEEAAVNYDDTTYEPVLPLTELDEALRAAKADSVLAVRLRNDAGIDPASIWAPVPGYTEDQVNVDWKPVEDGDLRDVWVLLQPTEAWYLEDVITVVVDARTLAGEPVESAKWQFQVESEEEMALRAHKPSEPLWQPEPDDTIDGVPVEAVVTEAGPMLAEPLKEGVQGPFLIGPERVYEKPQRVWLPIPQEVDPNDVRLYYYHPTGGDRGWYPAEKVQGWLVPDSYLQLYVDGTPYLGFLIRHAGIAQLGIPKEDRE